MTLVDTPGASPGTGAGGTASAETAPRTETAPENGNAPSPSPSAPMVTAIPRPAVSRRAVHPLVVFVFSTAFFSALATIYWNPALAGMGDARYYMSLALHPLRFWAAPWSFRILTPLIVWVVHVRAIYGFAAVTVLSLGAAATFMYQYLLEFYPGNVAIFGVALFVVSPAAVIELKNPVDVDAFFFAMVALAFLALTRRKWLLLGAALLLGVLDKETMLFVLLPMAVVAIVEYRFRPSWRWATLFGLPVLAYVLLHYTPLFFSPVPHSYGYLSSANISFVLREQDQLGGAGYSFFWSMVDTFGVLWIVAALFVSRADPRLRRTAMFIVPVLASVLFADNWARMLALGFVVVIPLVCAARLSHPIAGAVLFFSYDAIVSLGQYDLLGHPEFAVELPLLAVSVLAAIAYCRPVLSFSAISSSTASAARGLAMAARSSLEGSRLAIRGVGRLVARARPEGPAPATSWSRTFPVPAGSVPLGALAAAAHVIDVAPDADAGTSGVRNGRSGPKVAPDAGRAPGGPVTPAPAGMPASRRPVAAPPPPPARRGMVERQPQRRAPAAPAAPAVERPAERRAPVVTPAARPAERPAKRPAPVVTPAARPAERPAQRQAPVIQPAAVVAPVASLAEESETSPPRREVPTVVVPVLTHGERPEAIVHLEMAQGLLADIQLLTAAAAGEGRDR